MVVSIKMDLYDQAFSRWVISVYGKAVDQKGIAEKFDSYIGLCHDASLPSEKYDSYTFTVANEKRYFLAKIKYGF